MTAAAVSFEPHRGPARIRVGQIDIAYDVRGTGEPLLLLPGLSMRRIMWPEELCDGLAQLGFLVVRMDNRDAGDSSRVEIRPPNLRSLMLRSTLGLRLEVPYRLEDMARDAAGLMSALGHDRFHVAGASMGGMIAQTLAIEAPERLRTLTSIMSGPGGRRYAVGDPVALRALLKPLPRERQAQILGMIGTLRILNGNELPFDETRARTIAEAQIDGGTSPAAYARHFAAILESSGRRRARLRHVKTPTLVIHGSADPLLPLRGAVATARHIPRAELLVVKGMGHNLPHAALPIIAGAIATHARKAAHR